MFIFLSVLFVFPRRVVRFSVSPVWLVFLPLFKMMPPSLCKTGIGIGTVYREGYDGFTLKAITLFVPGSVGT